VIDVSDSSAPVEICAIDTPYEARDIEVVGHLVFVADSAGLRIFDATQVDATTLAFDPGGAVPDHSHGPHVEDVNADGIPGLVADFRTEQTGIKFGDRVDCLSGETLDGKYFEGRDSVRTAPDMDGDSLAM